MSNDAFSLIVLVVATVVAVGILAWLWRVVPPPPVAIPLPHYPVVLVHGIMGWDKFGYGPLVVSYFRGASQAMRAAGATVYTPRLPPLSSVPVRAEALAKFIRALPDTKVNIVAHSMGGLDARWAIAKLGIASKIACVVTVATPHHGSPLADFAARRGLRRIPAIDWLTTESAKLINSEALDQPGVVYGSVVSRTGKRLWLSNPVLFTPWLLMRGKHGASDGLVPAESQRWGSVWMEVEEDHWGQVGWSWRGSAPLYLRILQELASRGG